MLDFEVVGGFGGVGVGRENGKASGRHDSLTAGGSANPLTVNGLVTKQRTSASRMNRENYELTGMKLYSLNVVLSSLSCLSWINCFSTLGIHSFRSCFF